MKRAAWLAILCWLLSGAAQASPTGLNVIPTSDVVPTGQVTVGIQNGNTSIHDEPTVIRTPAPLFQSQFGIASRLEGGVDLGPSSGFEDYGPQLNLKWDALTEGYNRPAAAIGIQQVGPGLQTQYYVVVTRTLNYAQLRYQIFRAHHRNIRLRGRRVHAGLLRSGRDLFAFLGADLELSDHFVLYTDWTAGAAHFASLGGTYVINENNSVVASLLYSNGQKKINGVLFTYNLQLNL